MAVEELLAREGIRHTIASYTMARRSAAGGRFHDRLYRRRDFRDPMACRSKMLSAMWAAREIRAWITRWGRGAHEATPVHQAKFIRHHMSTCHIELTRSGYGESAYLLGGLYRHRTGPLRILRRYLPAGRRALAHLSPQGAPRLARARQSLYVRGRELAAVRISIRHIGQSSLREKQ